MMATTVRGEDKMNAFIDNLMSKMTLQEKIGQLNLPVTGDIVTGEAKSSDIATSIKNGQVGGLFNLKGADKIKEVQKIAVEQSRLGIPLIFGMDVIHGYETVFPIPLGLSCTWDMPAIERSARIAAQESTADGICWTFSPMVDISHDARWGRVSEGNGEDPYLGSRIAEAMVHGYQGQALDAKNTMMACVKHFALYGAAEAGRDYNTVDMSHWRMFNEYFPPYKAAFDAGAGSAMASFNIVDGIPATGNRWLQTEVLRNMWGFKGFVVTDYTGIAEMTPHGMGDLQEVSAMALKAGIDMDMVSDGLTGTLEKSLREGKVSLADIDQACRRVLEAKYKLGLFDDPYRYCDLQRAAKEVYTQAHREEARKTATESFVLLKNEGLLPLSKKAKIALIGPLANTRANMPGTWSVAAESSKYSTVLEAFLRAVKGQGEILYAKGCNLMYDAQAEADATMFGREMRDERSPEAMRAEALAIAAKSDLIVFAGGESSETSSIGDSPVKMDVIFLPLNEIFLANDWYVSYNNLGDYTKPFFDVAIAGSAGEGEVITTMAFTIVNTFSLYFVSGGYTGALAFDVESIGEDQVKLTYNASNNYNNGDWYYKNAGYDALLTPLERTFKLEGNSKIRPTVVRMIDVDEPANVFTVTTTPTAF